MEDINDVTRLIIGAAIEVHRVLGPGLREQTYVEALAIEFTDRDLTFERQVSVPVQYKDPWVGEYRLDFLVQEKVVVEIKSVDRYDPVFEAQVLAYLRASGRRVGLLINFNTALVRQGIKRLIL